MFCFTYILSQEDQETSVQMLSGIAGTTDIGKDLQRRSCDQNCPTCISGDFSPVGDKEGWGCWTHSKISTNILI